MLSSLAHILFAKVLPFFSPLRTIQIQSARPPIFIGSRKIMVTPRLALRSCRLLRSIAFHVSHPLLRRTCTPISCLVLHKPCPMPSIAAMPSLFSGLWYTIKFTKAPAFRTRHQQLLQALFYLLLTSPSCKYLFLFTVQQAHIFFWSSSPDKYKRQIQKTPPTHLS